MHHDVCPWWLGYLLANPLRKLITNPSIILRPYVHEGMTVLEPGPGMGFFTLQMARLIGLKGRVVAVDIQQKMLDTLKRRADRKGFGSRIEVRHANSDGMGIEDLKGKVEFILTFAVVHELPDSGKFFKESFTALRPGGKVLFSEPANHITQTEFDTSLDLARQAGFVMGAAPEIKSNHSALLVKTA